MSIPIFKQLRINIDIYYGKNLSQYNNENSGT